MEGAADLQLQDWANSGRLQLTAKNKATVWFDLVSLMPIDTFKVYFSMLVYLAKTSNESNESPSET